MDNGTVSRWFQSLDDKSVHSVFIAFKEKFCADISCSEKSLYNKIQRITKKVYKLRRNEKDKKSFMSEAFSVPENENNLARAVQASLTPREESLVGELHVLKKEKKDLLTKVSKLQTNLDDLSDKYVHQLDDMEKINSEMKALLISSNTDKEQLKTEIEKLKRKYSEEEKKMNIIEEKLQNCKESKHLIRNLNRKIIYKDNKIKSQKYEISQLKIEIKNIDNECLELYGLVKKETDKIEKYDTKIDEFKHEKVLLKRKSIYLQKKLQSIENVVDDDKIKEFDLLKHEVEEFRKRTITLEKENKELEQLIQILDDPVITTFEEGKYSNDVRECIMELLSLNVSMQKVNDVIKVVLKKLAKKDIDRLPSVGVKTRLMQEALFLGQVQVAEAMLEDVSGDTGNCLHGDGTSKYHRHFQNFQITTTSGKQLSFGLSEIASGDAESTLQCFSDTIKDLCDVIDNGESKDTNFAKLVTSIKNTMSDLGPVNPLFNRQLKSLRESLIPKVLENWDTLSEDRKDQLGDMGNFFCKLHLLANFASETDKVLSNFESLVLSDDYETVFAFNTKQAGVTRLIRTACKAFHVRGSDEAGVASYFNSFLDGQSESNHFVPFIGNRFNILFYNAASLYYHADGIKDFIRKYPNPNNLIKAVQEDISNSIFLAEARALGIVDKILTGPLWRIIESKSTILDLNPVLLKLKLDLSSMCKDASRVFDGFRFFKDEDVQLHDDEVFDKLFSETNEEFDVMTQQALEVVFHAFLIILERQCEDQLPGGKYWAPSETLKNMSKNVPTTNKASESDFAVLDLLVRTKPNSSIQTILSLTMWARNHTLDWLNEKHPEERDKIMNMARVKYEEMRNKYRERAEILSMKKKEKLAAKQKEKQENQEKKDKKR